MSADMIVSVAVFAAMEVAFLAWATWQAHQVWRRAEKHFGR
jgi:hypothetical protein